MSKKQYLMLQEYNSGDEKKPSWDVEDMGIGYTPEEAFSHAGIPLGKKKDEDDCYYRQRLFLCEEIGFEVKVETKIKKIKEETPSLVILPAKTHKV